MARSLALLGLVVATVATLTTAAGAAPPKSPPPTADPTFDPRAAAQSLVQIAQSDLAKCKATNAPKGDFHVLVTFASTGAASDAVVDKGTLAGTPVAKCIRTKFLKAHVPAFKGDAQQVGKTFRFE
jgi:hypothetical protein